jgi:hypothetical protein
MHVCVCVLQAGALLFYLLQKVAQTEAAYCVEGLLRCLTLISCFKWVAQLVQ